MRQDKAMAAVQHTCQQRRVDGDFCGNPIRDPSNPDCGRHWKRLGDFQRLVLAADINGSDLRTQAVNYSLEHSHAYFGDPVRELVGAIFLDPDEEALDADSWKNALAVIETSPLTDDEIVDTVSKSWKIKPGTAASDQLAGFLLARFPEDSAVDRCTRVAAVLRRTGMLPSVKEERLLFLIPQYVEDEDVPKATIAAGKVFGWDTKHFVLGWTMAPSRAGKDDRLSHIRQATRTLHSNGILKEVIVERITRMGENLHLEGSDVRKTIEQVIGRTPLSVSTSRSSTPPPAPAATKQEPSTPEDRVEQRVSSTFGAMKRLRGSLRTPA